MSGFFNSPQTTDTTIRQALPLLLPQYLLDNQFFPELSYPHQPLLVLPSTHPEYNQPAEYISPPAGSLHFVYHQRNPSQAECGVNPFRYPPQGYSTGRALCIGVNYFNQKGAMKGRTDEARSLCEYLQQVKHFKPESIILLTDDQNGHFGQPTKQNIRNALKWLGEHAFRGEKIVIYYTGHGQLPSIKEGKLMEAQGKQSGIGSMYPVDFRSSQEGIINAAEFEELLKPVKRKGAKLTLIYDTQAGIVD